MVPVCVLALSAGGCSLRLDFEECPGSPCSDGLICLDGNCVLPPNPGCAPPDPPIDGPAVVFGVVQNLTGDFNEASLSHQLAMKIAVEQVNTSGALGERQLSMIWCDSRNEDAVVADSIRYLVDRANVPAVLGIEASSLVVGNGPFTSERGAVLMSHWATAQSLTRFEQRPDGTTLVWRTSPSDRFQAKALGGIIDKACVGPKRVGVLFLDDDYGRGLADGLHAELCGPPDEGGPAECFAFRDPLPDVQPQGQGESRESDAERDIRVEENSRLLVKRVLERRNFIDVLAIFGFQDHAAAIFKQLNEQNAGSSGLTILVGEDVLSPAVLSKPFVKQLGLTVLGANPGLSRGRSFRPFERAFRAASQANDAGPAAAFAAHAYDSVMVLALAAAATPPGAELTGDALVAGLTRIADVEAERFGVEELLEAATLLRSSPQATMNYEGASGDLDFDPAVGEAPGTSIFPNLAQPEGTVCAATNLGVQCSPRDTPTCRAPCSQPFPEVSDAEGAKPLLLGGLASMSGENTALGKSRRQAMSLALDHLNTQGIGRPVQMVLCDAETDVDLAVAQADELIEDRGVSALIGPSSSAQSLAVSPRAVKAGVLMVTPSATAANLTTGAPAGDGGVRLVWRTAPSDSDQAGKLAMLVTTSGCVARLGLVYRNDVYGNGLRSGFINKACPTGDCPFDLVPQVLPDKGADEDYATIAAALTGADPPLDAVLLLAFRGEGVAVMKALKAAGFNRPVVASETIVAPGIAAEEGLDGLEILGTNPGLSRGPGYNEFAIPYSAEFNNETPDTFAAASYDAVVMVGLASVAAPTNAEPTGAGLSAGLARLTGGEQSFHPGELRGAATALASDPDLRIDYAGASGALDLDPATGQAPAEVPMYALIDGVLTPLTIPEAGPHPLCD